MAGVPTLEALCHAAKAQGHEVLALTDTNGLYGAIRFLEVARETGLKSILGSWCPSSRSLGQEPHRVRQSLPDRLRSPL